MGELGFTFTVASPNDRRPVRSILIDHVEWVSGMPRRPQPRRGWRGVFDWITGRHLHALHLHAIREAAWVEAGCPDVPQTMRTYIPRAVITSVEEPS